MTHEEFHNGEWQEEYLQENNVGEFVITTYTSDVKATSDVYQFDGTDNDGT